MIHNLIVPGVGGSEYQHWQSWLQRQLMSCSRVQQQDWNQPILKNWVAQCVQSMAAIEQPVQIIAHSFGCLTSVAALAWHPELRAKVKQLVLVAPANPARFGDAGFARDSHHHYADLFEQFKVQVPTQMLISENDPWLSLSDAQHLAKVWGLQAINLGKVGHINVASGFGPFPQIFDYLLPESLPGYMPLEPESTLLFKFAV